MLIQKPKGTYDLLPEKAFRRTFIETEIRKTFSDFNFKEIRTPTFEKTELFRRGIGEETDIVSKEMYSFNENEFTLKPEMTAPVIRAYIENSLFNESPLQKLFYISNMFRRERPQAGRFREHTQFGAEAIGSNDYFLDAEMIFLCSSILKRFGIENYKVKINTIGTVTEREVYLSDFKKYLTPFISELSKDSKHRFEKNPLRILDSKDKTDIEILKNAPLLYNYLSKDSADNFEKIKSELNSMKINYEVDPKLVRGIDYYTSTTFEFVSDLLGSQNSLLGGGRYNTLVEQLGGKPTPAIGFGAGMERLEMALEAINFEFQKEPQTELYIVTVDEQSKNFSFNLLNELRIAGIKSEIDYLNRSVKSQMKEANRLNAKYSIVIGEEELKTNSASLKLMSDSSEIKITDLKNLKTHLLNENKTSQT